MTTNRREFMQIVAGGITFALAAKNIELPKVTEPPTTTLLGKELTTPKSTELLSEGWYQVKIVDIDIKDSHIRPEPNFWFKFEEVESKRELVQVISSVAPYYLLEMVKKTEIPNVHDSVDLNDMIGKEIKVKVEHQIYMDKTYMVVKQ